MKSYSFLILSFNPYELIRLEVFFQLLFRFTSVNQQQIQNQAVALSQTKQKYKCKTGKNQEICKVHVLSWNVNHSCGVTEAICDSDLSVTSLDVVQGIFMQQEKNFNVVVLRRLFLFFVFRFWYILNWYIITKFQTQ